LLGKDRREATSTKLSLSSAAPLRDQHGAAMSMMAISAIKVGKRIRRDMGDIASLAESIEDIGLLNPITVDEDGRLLAGARRLAACKRLGWKKIRVNVVECG
jgi:ParB family transcriptional regulator, chromosome partitioning protein